MAAKNWNPRKSALLLQMYASGKHSTGEIAEKLHVSPPTIYDRLRRLGLRTSSLPRRYKAAVKFTFTKAEEQKIRRWKQEGVYDTEVALRLSWREVWV